MIGNFDGNFKLSAHYRNQWTQFNTPLTTTFASAAMKLPKQNNYWAFDLSLLKDELNFLTYNQYRLMGSVAYHKKLSDKLTAGAGFQGGIRMTSIDYDKLTFDRQWDPNTGNFDDSQPNFENFTLNNISTPFINIGGSINIHKKKILHTFDISTLFVLNSYDTLNYVYYDPLKLQANYQLFWKITDKVKFIPKIGGIYTARANEILSGLIFQYIFDDTKNVYFGSSYRWGVDRNPDALVPVAGVNLNSFRIGVSYDINTSGIKQEGYKSAYELTLVYVFKLKKNKFYSIDCLRL